VPILAFCVSRLAQLVPVLLGITVVAFLLLRVMPGDPASLILGSRGTPDDIAALTRQLGLDRPFWQQYFGFVEDLLHGNFGRSIAFKREIGPLILERLGPSLALVGLGTLLAVILTIPLAMLTAIHRGGVLDHGVRLVFVVAMSMPAFWLGVLLVLLLSIMVPVFPVSGYGASVAERLHHLALPCFIIAIGTTALTVRSLRSSIIGVLSADYVDTARAKGLGAWAVLSRHVFRNSLTSTISVLAVHTSWIIGGTVVIEAVFGIPGLGSLLVAAISARDYPLVQTLTVTFALLVVGINLLADLAYALVDPRVGLA